MILLFIKIVSFFSFAAHSSDLSLNILGKESKWTQDQLIEHPNIQRVKLSIDPNNNGQDSLYYAISIVDFLGSAINSEAQTIHMIAKDGMAVVFDKERLLSSTGAKAFLAIAPFGQEWPQKNGLPIGPYYLFWLSPETSKISPEEWPYLIHRIEIHSGFVEKDFPLTIPSSKLNINHPAQQGFRIFLKNCFSCHTINQQGPSKMGPDLNFPRSPIEYMKSNYLKQYIRNPKSLRHWPQSKMPAFDETNLSETDLWKLLNYFTHMVSQRNIKTSEN